jgi:dipeptidyl aminopeptidase/acylaminoacyl peptidase
VWFTSLNSPDAGVAMRAASAGSPPRTLLSLPTDWRLLDVASDGRLLVASELVARHIEVRREGEAPRELAGNFEQAIASAMSPDGRSVLMTDQGGFAGTSYQTYLRRTDEASAVPLGEGQALDFSPDRSQVLTIVNGPPARLLLLPIGAGQPRELPNPEKFTMATGAFLPDGKRVAFVGSKGTAAMRGYVQDIATGTARPFTGEGVSAPAFSSLPIAPDGSAAWLLGPDGRPMLYPMAGGDPRPLAGVRPDDNLVLWAPDGRALYVSSISNGVRHIDRVELPAGTRTAWKDVVLSQQAGVRMAQVLLTPDGKTELYSYSQLLTSLYVVNGLPPRR